MRYVRGKNLVITDFSQRNFRNVDFDSLSITLTLIVVFHVSSFLSCILLLCVSQVCCLITLGESILGSCFDGEAFAVVALTMFNVI